MPFPSPGDLPGSGIELKSPALQADALPSEPPGALGIWWASPMAQWVKNPPSMQETPEMRVHSLGWEDPLEKEMATHSSILA